MGRSEASVTVTLSLAAAVFLRATVEHMNQAKMLPADSAQALQTSAWLEEIEAETRRALSEATSRGPSAT
jgi:hypothetical protein